MLTKHCCLIEHWQVQTPAKQMEVQLDLPLLPWALAPRIQVQDAQATVQPICN